MFESGQFVADVLGDLRESQIQPNGVDLTLGAVYEQTSPGRIERGSKTIGDRRETALEDGLYRLDPGGYVVEYGDKVVIPEPGARIAQLVLAEAAHEGVYDGRYQRENLE